MSGKGIHTRIFGAPGLFGLAIGAIAAFAGTPVLADHAPGAGGKFTVHVNRPFVAFDPMKMPRNDMGRLQIMHAVNDVLFYKNQKTGELIPRLGLSANASDDFKTWRVKLRQGVKYSNGEELTSEAYVHHFTRVLDSRLKGLIQAALKAKLEKVVAIDKYTVEFQLSEPNVAFDSMMAGAEFVWMINPPGFARANENKPEYARQLLGAGPYMIKEWVTGKGITLVRNPNYWNPKEQHADEIFYKVTQGPEGAGNWNQIKAGDIDVSWSFGGIFNRAKQAKGYDFIQGYRTYSGWVINFNSGRPPFNDVRVRKAMAHAIDRKQIAGIISRGTAELAQEGFDPSRRWHCGNIKHLEYNPEKAKALLKEYGKPVEFTMWSHGGPFTKTAEVAQEMLRNVGVTVHQKKVGPGPGAIFKNVAGGKVDAWVFLGGLAAHPTLFDTNMHSSHKGNVFKISSPKLDTAIDKLNAARGDDAIKKAHCAFEQAKAEEVPYLHITYGVAGLFKKKNIGGIEVPQTPLLGYHRLYRK